MNRCILFPTAKNAVPAFLFQICNFCYFPLSGGGWSNTFHWYFWFKSVVSVHSEALGFIPAKLSWLTWKLVFSYSLMISLRVESREEPG